MAMTPAERQRRYRERRAAGVPVEAPRPRGPKTRPARWAAALAELRTLQAEYQAWLDGLPESLAGSRTAELLEGVCDVDLDDVDVELPRGDLRHAIDTLLTDQAKRLTILEEAVLRTARSPNDSESQH